MYLPRIGVSFQKPLRDVMLFDCNQFFFVAKNKGGCYSFFCAIFFYLDPHSTFHSSVKEGFLLFYQKSVNSLTWFFITCFFFLKKQRN